MKKQSFLAMLAICSLALLPSACIDDDYDLDKKFDKTTEIKNVSIKVNQSYSFAVQDIIGDHSFSGDFSFPLEADASGKYEFGSAEIDRIGQYVSSDYQFKEANLTAGISCDIPYDLTATAKAYDAQGKEIRGITVTCTPSVIKGGATTKVTFNIKGSAYMNFDAVKITLLCDEPVVTLNTAQKVAVSDIIVNIPSGILNKN